MINVKTYDTGIEHDVEYIDLTNKPDWFLKLSPLGKVPVLVHGDDVLFESHVILEYLNDLEGGRKHYLDPMKKAKDRALMEYGSTILANFWGMLMSPTKEGVDEKKAVIESQLVYLNEQMIGTSYFHGDESKLIDYSFYPVLQRLVLAKSLYDIDLLENYSALKNWHLYLSKQNAFAQSYPDNLDELVNAMVKRRGGFLAA